MFSSPLRGFFISTTHACADRDCYVIVLVPFPGSLYFYKVVEYNQANQYHIFVPFPGSLYFYKTEEEKAIELADHFRPLSGVSLFLLTNT